MVSTSLLTALPSFASKSQDCECPADETSTTSGAHSGGADSEDSDAASGHDFPLRTLPALPAVLGPRQGVHTRNTFLEVDDGRSVDMGRPRAATDFNGLRDLKVKGVLEATSAELQSLSQLDVDAPPTAFAPAWCWVEPDGEGGFEATHHIDDSLEYVLNLDAANAGLDEVFAAALAPPAPGSYVPAWQGPRDVSPTTLVLDRLPAGLSQVVLLEVLDREGFCGLYDFVFLPTDLATERSVGYAIVNMRRQSHGEALAAKLHGKKFWGLDEEGMDACRVRWSWPLQGLAEHVRLYRNHPSNHEGVPEDCRPQLFSRGWPAAFPAATAPLTDHLNPECCQMAGYSATQWSSDQWSSDFSSMQVDAGMSWDGS